MSICENVVLLFGGINVKKELEKHYLATTYSVYIDAVKYDISIEQPLPKFIEQLVNKHKTAAILTAWNPRSQPLSLSENHSRNKQLSSNIEDHILYKCIGQGDDLTWTAEESFFILGISRAVVDKLAIYFEQYAYVWCDNSNTASLIFTELWNDKF